MASLYGMRSGNVQSLRKHSNTARVGEVKLEYFENGRVIANLGREFTYLVSAPY